MAAIYVMSNMGTVPVENMATLGCMLKLLFLDF